jgi:sulfur relay (sulfurtransferase) complex TusBCD TusD component (DsrE family)
MKFVLAIHSRGAQKNAHHFAHALLRQGHEISLVFFYKEGVLSDESLWINFNVPLIACHTSCERRKANTTFFQKGTLTQFFDALLKTDRYVVFN